VNCSPPALTGFLEGERVVKIETTYPPGMIVLGVPRKAKRSHDPRYTYNKLPVRQPRELDATIWLRSDGSIYLKYEYRYTGNRKEELVEFDSGLKLEKKVYMLDKRGNELELLHCDPDNNSLNYKETYSYLKFDSQGNWIKRLESDKEKLSL
jgi:hypothetical protein